MADNLVSPLAARKIQVNQLYGGFGGLVYVLQRSDGTRASISGDLIYDVCQLERTC
jgi:hypothetical protein